MMNFLFSPDVRRNPYPWYDEVRKASPVLPMPQVGRWLLFDYDGVKRALHDHDAFSSVTAPPEAKTSQWLIFMDPPRHAKLRGLIARAFTPRAVAALEPRIRELARELLGAHVARGEMDLVADFAVPLPLMVIAEMLGAPASDGPLFRRWAEVMLLLAHVVSGAPQAASAIERFVAMHAEMKGYLAELLAARRAHPADDLLTRLLAAEVDGERLSDDEILGFFQLLLLAGHETTTNLIGNAVLSFVEWPDQLARLRAAPELLPSAIEEVLRYRSPVQAALRVTRRDVELGGRTIPAGQVVVAMIGSANRDPKHFGEADRFDVARDPNPHLAFGSGIHFCIGAPLARLEGRVALTELLERAHGLRLGSDEPWEPREAFHVHGPSALPIRFDAAPRANEATIG